MGEYPIKIHSAVGVVFLAGLALLVVMAIFWKGTIGRHYIVLVEFENVQGLVEGDAVYFKGVQTGAVAAVVLEGGKPVARLSIEKQYASKLTTDSLFYMATDNQILNQKCIIWEGGTSAELIPENAKVTGYDSKIKAKVGRGWEATKDAGEMIIKKTKAVWMDTFRD